MLKSLSVLVIIYLCGFSIQAQDSTNMNNFSNRVGATKASRTIGKGNFLLEGGIPFSYYKTIIPFTTPSTDMYVSAPEFQLTYGISKKLEVSLLQRNFDFYSENIRSNYPLAGSDLGLQLKFELFQQKGWLPQTALILSEHVFSGTEYTSDFYSEVGISWSYDLNKKLNLAGDLIYAFGGAFKNDFGTSLRLNYTINSKIGMYTEFQLTPFLDYTSNLNLGMWYQLNDRWMFHVNVGSQINPNNFKCYQNENLGVSLGVSFLLNNPNKKKKYKRK